MTGSVSFQAGAMPAAMYWRGVAYGNGIFCAVNSGGNYGSSPSSAATSPDGITWTPHSITNRLWQSLAFGNGVFCAVCGGFGGSRSAVSSDGATWTEASFPVSINNPRVAFFGGEFVIVSDTRVLTSADGLSWSDRGDMTPLGGSFGQPVGVGGVLYVAGSVGSAAVLSSSADGVSWAQITSFTGMYGSGVAGANGAVVATHESDLVVHRKSGTSAWADVAIPSPLARIAGGAGLLAVPTGGNKVGLSYDGSAWEVFDLPISRSWGSNPVLHDGKYVLVAFDSTDVLIITPTFPGPVVVPPFWTNLIETVEIT